MLLICLFFPTFISLRNDTQKNKTDLLVEYATNNIIINLISFLVVYLIMHSESVINENIFTVKFSVVYLIFSSFIALILPSLKRYISNNFSFSIERKCE